MIDRVLSVVPSNNGVEEQAEPPVAAGRVLGTHLRQLRELAGHRLKDVVDAGVIGSSSTLSRYEDAKTPFKEEVVIALAKFYGRTDEGELAALRDLTRQSLVKEWWACFRDVVPGWLGRLISMESAAREIRTYEGFFVPGLLQTSKYARAVMRAPYRRSAGEDPDEKSESRINRRLRVRLRRQRLLDEADAPDYYALLDESILNKPTGGRAVMREQLRHLFNYAENRDRIHIRVLPFTAAEHAAAPISAITLLKFPQGKGSDMAYLEGGTYVSNPQEVEEHKVDLLYLWDLAADKKATLNILQHYIDKLAETDEP
ncbi:helix-turn-helix domain-containing protein [Streptomyces sp. NPDC048644]|uniref:helix-turn-helix domain-containing protein n=1 Tax=Streptomyces sp. NPDC048644 TaxID=3365582 RepID=UPI00370FAEC5